MWSACGSVSFRGIVAVGAALLVAAACGGGNRENSPVCGFASMAGATMVLDQMRTGTKVLTAVPAAVEGPVPTRVVGYGTSRSLAAPGADGVVLTYEGEGLPRIPGFGLILVEDSAETFKGVLVFETEPPLDYPLLGAISDPVITLPVYGLRVTWAAVSQPRCPLFAEIDTTTP